MSQMLWANIGPTAFLIEQPLACTTCMFVVRHPRDRALIARCGYDAQSRGYFVDLESSGCPVTYDAAEDDYDGVRGAVRMLADWGFVQSDDVCDALELLRDPRVNEVVPGRVRRVLRVLTKLRMASGD